MKHVDFRCWQPNVRCDLDVTVARIRISLPKTGEILQFHQADGVTNQARKTGSDVLDTIGASRIVTPSYPVGCGCGCSAMMKVSVTFDFGLLKTHAQNCAPLELSLIHI